MTEAKTKTLAFPTVTAALVAFQSDLPAVVKDSSANTGKYSYDYATLENLTEIIFPKLTAVGLGYTAVPTVRDDGVFVLRAQLVHESGDFISGDYPLGNPNNPAQAIGSAISYARRYALLSLTGVAPAGEDDDGAKASAAQSAAPTPERSEAPATVTATLRAELGEMINGSGGKVTGEDANAILDRITGGKAPGEWTAANLKEAKKQITALIAER